MGQNSDTQRLSDDIAHTRGDLTRDVDALADKVSPGRVVERGRQRVRDRLTSAKESVMGSAHDTSGSVRQHTSSVGGSVGSAAGSTVHGARQRAQGNPIAAGLVAFGVGWLVSSVLPATEKEAQAAKRLEETAREHGQPVAEQAKQAGREMGEHLKDSASQAAHEVKDTARQSTERVTDEGRSSAQHVQESRQG